MYYFCMKYSGLWHNIIYLARLVSKRQSIFL